MRLLGRLFKRINNTGMSLVELICAIGIMSLVGASVAGFMIVSANTYNRGASEVNLQEEAQLLASQINNLIQDASDAVSSGGDFSSLEVTRKGEVYNVYLDNSGDASRANKVYYVHNGEEALMAENVQFLVIDTAEFQTSGVVQLYICLKKGDNSYAGNYTVSSRNIDVVATMTEHVLTMNYTPEYVLEPGQVYPLTATMSDGSGVDYALVGNTSAATLIELDHSSGQYYIHVGTDETADKVIIDISSKTRMEDGYNPAVQHNATAYIRRVNEIVLTEETEHEKYNAGAVHTLKAYVNGTYLDKLSPAIPDPGFDDPSGIYYNSVKTPRDIKWDIKVWTTKNTYEWGNLKTTQTFEHGKDDNYGGLIDVTYVGDKCNIKLKRNLVTYQDWWGTLKPTETNIIYVYVYSQHGGGQNITGTPYFDEYREWELSKGGSYITFDGSNLKRYSDNAQGEFSGFETVKQKVINQYGNGDYQAYKEHRVREVVLDDYGNPVSYGPWTTWRLNPQDQKNISINLRPLVTSLDIEKAYEIEIRLGVATFNGDNSIKRVYWPVTSGDNPTPESEYMVRGIVKPVVCHFAVKNSWSQLKSDYVGGSEVFSGGNYFEIQYLKDKIENIGVNSGMENCVKYTVERKRGKDSEGNDIWESVWGSEWNVQAWSDNYTFKFTFDRAGEYRVKCYLENAVTNTYNPTTKQYVDGKRNYQYWNETTGKGIFYINVSQHTDRWNNNYFEYDGGVYSKSDFASYRSGNTYACARGNDIYYSNDGGLSYWHWTCSYSSTAQTFTVTDPSGNSQTLTEAQVNSIYGDAIGQAIKGFK